MAHRCLLEGWSSLGLEDLSSPVLPPPCWLLFLRPVAAPLNAVAAGLGLRASLCSLPSSLMWLLVPSTSWYLHIYVSNWDCFCPELQAYSPNSLPEVLAHGKEHLEPGMSPAKLADSLPDLPTHILPHRP